MGNARRFCTARSRHLQTTSMGGDTIICRNYFDSQTCALVFSFFFLFSRKAGDSRLAYTRIRDRRPAYADNGPSLLVWDASKPKGAPRQRETRHTNRKKGDGAWRSTREEIFGQRRSEMAEIRAQQARVYTLTCQIWVRRNTKKEVEGDCGNAGGSVGTCSHLDK